VSNFFYLTIALSQFKCAAFTAAINMNFGKSDDIN